jgi:hypothetical protein
VSLALVDFGISIMLLPNLTANLALVIEGVGLFLEYMTKPKMKSIIDFSTCHHDTKEGFQAKSDFTYLKKSYRDGL